MEQSRDRKPLFKIPIALQSWRRAALGGRQDIARIRGGRAEGKVGCTEEWILERESLAARVEGKKIWKGAPRQEVPGKGALLELRSLYTGKRDRSSL